MGKKYLKIGADEDNIIGKLYLTAQEQTIWKGKENTINTIR